MAFIDVLKNLFLPAEATSAAAVSTLPAIAPSTSYSIAPLTPDDLASLVALNLRCFRNGENYTKHTFLYLLTQPNALCYKATSSEGEIAGFVCMLAGEDGTGHITTIGVAPEHRRRGIAARLMHHMEDALLRRGITSAVLEVRVSNEAARRLYMNSGYAVVQQLHAYYSDGEDAYLMVKAIWAQDAAAAA